MYPLYVSVISLHPVCSFGYWHTTVNKIEIPGERHNIDLCGGDAQAMKTNLSGA